MHSIHNLTQMLNSHRARHFFARRLFKRCAVLLLLREQAEGAEVLMIRRSHREGDPWSGQMGFPGGRREEQDSDDLATATREVQEEIGLDVTTSARYLGQLSDSVTHFTLRRAPMTVKPYVFQLLQQDCDYLLSDEVAEIVWVPIRFFTDCSNRSTRLWRLGAGRTVKLPCYYYRGYQIWGLSLRILDELLGVS